MTDFDFGSVYGSGRTNPVQALFSAISRVMGTRTRPAVQTVAARKADARRERDYLADIGMEIGL